VLDAIEDEKLVERTAKMGEELSAQLRELARKFPNLFEGERGVGLLRGLMMKTGVEARTVMMAARERGVLLSVASERVLRFSPPLVITSELIAEAMRAIEAGAQSLSAKSSETTQPSA